jgi:transposase
MILFAGVRIETVLKSCGPMVTLRDMENRTYPTDPSDEEWGLLEAYLPASKWRGRPRLHSPREILDAVFYVLKSGCRWRMLPRELPPWKTVFHYFRAWRLDGTFERTNRALRRRLREKLGRDPEPSAGIVDSRSAKTTGVGGSLVVEARVHSARVSDRDGIERLLAPAHSRVPRLS